MYCYHNKSNTKIRHDMNENENTVKTPMKSKFFLEPKTKKEEKYLKELNDLLGKKRYGDWQVIGEMLEISAASAEKAFLRVYQKNHFEVVEALEKIIKNRENLIK
ncbi:hypothetical protein EGI16_10815 [Chryseobacterium sp. G0240]|nr:hypothetical protein EGI16_10815 [Chryseobacterium sp. G0240]